MAILTSPHYTKCRTWITDARKHKLSWEEIKFGRSTTEEGLEEFLSKQHDENFWPLVSIDEWFSLVESHRDTEKREKEFLPASTMIVDKHNDNEITIPTSSSSSWQLYKAHLLKSGFKDYAVQEIEQATHSTLKRLNTETVNSEPVKGLIIGHVQSGKTANMAALMAMAADWGWNFFIVLSGTIENLRKQTQQRLTNDLNHPGNITWFGLEHLSKKSILIHKLQHLILEEGSNQRYFTVCLKNSSRLRNLLEWMYSDPNKARQLKVIVIDDEADQASINTAPIEKEERTKINELLVNLVEGNNHKGIKMSPGVKAMNYISYTATPYANFLNESLPESLYPSSFIRTLTPSNEYFGPQQFFGGEETDSSEGLDIIRLVDTKDIDTIKNMSKNFSEKMPESLIDSLCWFLCCVATFRHWNYKKPVSMLIHTSQRQSDHDILANLITDWFNSTSHEYIINRSRQVWNFETSNFSKESFRASFPKYGVDDSEINDYPKFKLIEPHIRTLINDITHIPLDEEGDLSYTKHIHLCIDNCSKNGVNEDGLFVRLAFPDSSNSPSFATAFIVIGGSTLSRGLTLEGLVSTYFLRTTYQADTLMQMGRWFGYRKGYELLPRLWISLDTYNKFKFLTTLEDELRDDLKRFSSAGALPTEFGPRVKNTPKVSWLRITSKNKMQSAFETDLDFSGTSSQLILYEKSPEIQRENIRITESFLRKLGSPNPSVKENSYVWRNISFSTIQNDLLTPMTFHPRATLFNESQLPSFIEWVNTLTTEGILKNWNVIVAGVSPNSKNTWNFGLGVTGKVNRSQKSHGLSNNLINLGVLRAPNDLIADVDGNILSDKEVVLLNSTVSIAKVDELREKSGLGNTPQLLIYRVLKDSTARSGKSNNTLRKDLDLDEDLIGLNIYIPGSRNSRNLARTLTIKLTQNVESEYPEE